ncbi:MAG: ATP-dependent DNA ligase [Candidatus Helarchaeota archaeon]
MPTSFLNLAKLCDKLEKISKTKEKIALISNFLRSLSPNEIKPAVFLIIGTPFAESESQTLDISWRSILETNYTAKQTTLFNQPLTIRAVHEYFCKLAQISGSGARKKRKRLLEMLFRESSPLERKFLVRMILGEMRHGVAKGLMIKAIAEAAHLDYSLIKRLSAIYGNIGEIARLALVGGEEGLIKIEVAPFTPIKPMLAENLDSLDGLFKKPISPMAIEYKYDGVRVQIHKKADKVHIYSRRLKDITSNFPEIADLIKKTIPNHSCILDGEIIAIRRNDQRPLPFQELMRRFKRIHEVQRLRQEIPVQLYLFDILLLDDKILFDYPYQERWNILATICKGLTLASRIISSEKEEITRFYQAALAAGHEGILLKKLNSPYSPGERKKDWLKLKEAIHADLVIIAADWGSGRRTGWLSNYHLAALDPLKGTFHEVGKTFKGLTDEEFQDMTANLQKIKTYKTQYTVYVKPQIVVEVAFNEIQKSPQYPAGYALRFARIKRIRLDKDPSEVTSLDEIAYLYERQFEKKARI